MNLEVSPEKTRLMIEQYNNDPEKGNLTRKEYAKKLAASDPKFIPWLFDFEQNEQRSDLSTGMTREVNTAFDNWTDIYHNY
ncbi:MAG: hypothetical protein RR346_01550 [Bacteroidales bacterium]